MEEGLEPDEGKRETKKKSLRFFDELVEAESREPEGAAETNDTEAFIFTLLLN